MTLKNFFLTVTNEGGLELKVPGFYFASYSQTSPNQGFFETLIHIPFAGAYRLSYLEGDGFQWFLINKTTINSYLNVIGAYTYYREYLKESER